MATHSPEALVGQLVAERGSRAKVFERFGIDYCCGGKVSVAEAAGQRGIDPVSVLAALDAVDAALGATTDDRDWSAAPLEALLAHLVDRHHAYVREALPRLGQLVDKVARAEGEAHPELNEVAATFRRLQAALTAHLEQEEAVVFPRVRRLAQGSESGARAELAGLLSKLEADHVQAAADLAALHDLTRGYVAPEGACNSHRAMLDGLRELEQDTHRHVHLENNVLFPRVLAQG
jgi:regulator of cell morphogenesis and NO signaling